MKKGVESRPKLMIITKNNHFGDNKKGKIKKVYNP